MTDHRLGPGLDGERLEALGQQSAAKIRDGDACPGHPELGDQHDAGAGVELENCRRPAAGALGFGLADRTGHDEPVRHEVADPLGDGGPRQVHRAGEFADGPRATAADQGQHLPCSVDARSRGHR